MTLRLLLIFLLVCSFGGCSNPAKKKKKPDEHAQTVGTDFENDPTFQSFINRLRVAVAAHDVQMLSEMMTEDFGYRWEPPGEGTGVFQYWEAELLWPQVQSVVSQKWVPLGSYMVAPPEFAAAPDAYTGFRAGVKLVNGSWRFAYFVKK